MPLRDPLHAGPKARWIEIRRGEFRLFGTITRRIASLTPYVVASRLRHEPVRLKSPRDSSAIQSMYP